MGSTQVDEDLGVAQSLVGDYVDQVLDTVPEGEVIL